jgi:anaerobic selenocysteine-containing dehydrogenase
MNTVPAAAELVRIWCKDSRVDYDTLRAHPAGVLVDMPAVTVQSTDDDGRRLALCPDDIRDELGAVRAQNSSGEYPFRLTVRRLLETMNSAYRDAERTRRKYPTNRAYLNPQDMHSIGAINGDIVEIRSAHGAILGVAHTDPGVGAGTISMSHMWGSPQTAQKDSALGAHTGRLVSLEQDCDPINHMPVMTAIPVQLRLVPAQLQTEVRVVNS